MLGQALLKNEYSNLVFEMDGFDDRQSEFVGRLRSQWSRFGKRFIGYKRASSNDLT